MRVAFTLALLACVGCTWETDLPADASSIPVVRGRELIVTDDAVLDALSRDDASGVLGFRHASEKLPLAEGAMLRWLGALRLDAASLRLIAVANRTDLSVMPDRAADGGEGRLVFALADGPVAIIFEYAQRGPALEWTKRWHALGAVRSSDFPARLSELVATFVDAGSIAQIRTADARTGPTIFQQFVVLGGEIVPTNVRNSPDWNTVPKDALARFVDEQPAAIEDGTAVLPATWWASSSSSATPAPGWVTNLPHGDALVRETCSGCHQQTAHGFQIDPQAKGEAKLSPFVRDEFDRRTEWMQLTLWKSAL